MLPTGEQRLHGRRGACRSVVSVPVSSASRSRSRRSTPVIAPMGSRAKWLIGSRASPKSEPNAGMGVPPAH